ncbi:MAG TPA: serine/threonine-protein kinase [Candidatus Binataceae bacterium]|nr:serine/threonine-protein kinase [Candidatus Binataceae bacterium]
MADSAQAEAGNTGPLATGTLLQNRYLIERLIGGGGMGVVYLAHDQRLANRPCALKEMVDHFIDPQQRREASEYFAREADTLAQLRHPAIPAITDRFDHANRHYLVMEYVEGRNLEEELAVAGRPLAESLVVDIARQLCEVLAYLHGFVPPIVYRDMKPSNVMLTPKGRVMLIDFGIARLFKPASKGTMIGTLGFAPPEQYQGQVDPRSDIYSLGATLHFILTARDPEKYPPFSFPPVRSLRPTTSVNLAGAVDRALSYDAEKRPATIGEFRDMMLYGTGLEGTAQNTVSPRGGTADLTRITMPERPAPPRTRARRSRLVRAIRMAVLVLLFGSVAFGATYVYFDPPLQQRLGLTPYLDQLPWRHEQLLAQLRADPLRFERMTVQLSTREGSPVSPPQAKFTDSQLANDRYLSWDATFKNRLYGIEGSSQKIQARFYDPNGLQVAASNADRFVSPDEKTTDFSAVALLPAISQLSRGPYTIALYRDDKLLGREQFSIVEDLAAEKRAEAAQAAAAAAAKKAEEQREQDARRLAMIAERRAHPLELLNISFLNTTKTGTPLSGPSTTFNAAKVLFVGWQATFKNRLFGLDMNQYRVDAAYQAPDGRTLGSVDDVRMVSDKAKEATFSGRIGNSAGGAFLPGSYTVNFYLNGQYLTQKHFRVVSTLASAGSSMGAGSGLGLPAAAPPPVNFDSPMVASGTIDGLAGRDGIALEMRLRPQPNGFLHGELDIHQAGYGSTPIDGFVRGSHIEFQVPYGTKTLYFEGERRTSGMSGHFQSEPAGEQGNWNARID